VFFPGKGTTEDRFPPSGAGCIPVQTIPRYHWKGGDTLTSSLVSPQKRRSPVFLRLGHALPVVRGRFGVKRIGVFGSFARGDQKRTSDVDVLVEFAEGQATFDNFMQLVYYLEELFGRNVDLLTTGGIDKYIRHRVEREVIWIEG
jgi:predicted nucleotidyltransferase